MLTPDGRDDQKDNSKPVVHDECEKGTLVFVQTYTENQIGFSQNCTNLDCPRDSRVKSTIVRQTSYAAKDLNLKKKKSVISRKIRRESYVE